MDLFNLDSLPPDRSPASLALSFREARIVQVAVRLKLFTGLSEGPQSAERLAARLKCDPAMMERLLVALAVLDLVVHDDGLWRNGLAASLYLVVGQPLYQGDTIEWAAQVWNSYHHLERMVRKGRRREERLFALHQERDWQVLYLKAMHALGVAGQAQRLARLVTPLAGRKRLLALGSAPCTYSIALCQRFPALRATVLERADALPESESILAQWGGGERVTLKPLAEVEKGWGRSNYDALLLTHLLLDSEAQALTTFMRAYEALKAEGLLIVHSLCLDSDLNGGREAALTNLLDPVLTLDQMRAVLAEAGFERISLLFRHPVEGDILIAYKPTDASDEPDGELMAFISPEQEIFALMGLGEDETQDALTIHRRAWERLVQTN